jgi:hypothetical protein
MAHAGNLTGVRSPSLTDVKVDDQANPGSPGGGNIAHELSFYLQHKPRIAQFGHDHRFLEQCSVLPTLIPLPG